MNASSYSEAEKSLPRNRVYIQLYSITNGGPLRQAGVNAAAAAAAAAAASCGDDRDAKQAPV